MNPMTLGPRLVEPGQPAYEASAPWNTAVLSRPAAVVRAGSAEDVSDAIRYAAQRGLRVAVRSSGHGATPLRQDTLLVHTGEMTDVAIDADRQIATIGAGAAWQPVLDAAAPHGLAAICGSAPHIGAVGYLTGGGLGPLARTYGVSSDLVRSLEVVVGDGRVLRATPTENVDLFWGLRGGKATLGIVTSVDLALVPLTSFYGGALWFSAWEAADVLHAWHALCSELPEQGTTSAAVLRLPEAPGVPPALARRQTLAIRFGWVGAPDDGEALLEPLRRMATPVLDTLQVRPYPQIGQVHCDPFAPASIASQSALLGELTSAALDALVEATAPEANLQHVVELRHLGGAVAAPAEHASAFCHRDAGYSLFMSGPADAGLAAVEEQGARIRQALAPWTEPGLFPNFAGSSEPDQIRRSYDADTAYWLEELGDHYDPDHVLDVGQVVRRPDPRR